MKRKIEERENSFEPEKKKRKIFQSKFEKLQNEIKKKLENQILNREEHSNNENWKVILCDGEYKGFVDMVLLSKFSFSIKAMISIEMQEKERKIWDLKEDNITKKDFHNFLQFFNSIGSIFPANNEDNLKLVQFLDKNFFNEFFRLFILLLDAQKIQLFRELVDYLLTLIKLKKLETEEEQLLPKILVDWLSKNPKYRNLETSDLSPIEKEYIKRMEHFSKIEFIHTEEMKDFKNSVDIVQDSNDAFVKKVRSVYFYDDPQLFDPFNLAITSKIDKNSPACVTFSSQRIENQKVTFKGRVRWFVPASSQSPVKRTELIVYGKKRDSSIEKVVTFLTISDWDIEDLITLKERLHDCYSELVVVFDFYILLKKKNDSDDDDDDDE